MAYGLETCPDTGRKHHQGCIYFSGQRNSVKGVARDLGNSHVERCCGNLDQNLDYCGKEGELIEIGNRPRQGKRVDLDLLKDEIMNGDQTVEDIVLNNPMAYHQYGRTLNKIEDIALRKKWRTWMTKGIWIYGKTSWQEP